MIVVVLDHAAHDRVEVVEPVCVDADVRARRLDAAEPRGDDDTGKAHPADRRVEESDVVGTTVTRQSTH